MIWHFVLFLRAVEYSEVRGTKIKKMESVAFAFRGSCAEGVNGTVNRTYIGHPRDWVV